MGTHGSRGWLAGLGVLMAAGLALPAAAAPPAAPLPARAAAIDPGTAFLRVWSRSDWPLKLQLVTRSWTWGPQPIDARTEPYAEGVGGVRVVQYWD
ncbi:MAG TPA: hypothetical protein VKY74_00880, partial [Chloroflexia bacterium]|nr:hypothetical protein [Chloroflexia bacterium]